MAEYQGAMMVCEEQVEEKVKINHNGDGGGEIVVGVGSSSSDAGLGVVGGARKPRGRPPGSKNKPKPPIIITKESEASVKTSVVEVIGGSDVVETLYNFTCRRGLGVSILSASGCVSNITLRDPTKPNSTLILPGYFQILSLSGSFLPLSLYCSNSTTPPPPPPPNSFPLAISVAGNHGQIFGGIVAEKLMAVNPVHLVVATFTHPSFYRLPICEDEGPAADDDDRAHVNVNAHSDVGIVVHGPSTSNNPISGYNDAPAAGVPNPLNSQMPFESWDAHSPRPQSY